MIHKEEEIYEWFKGAVSSQRIDVVCSLLRLCLPLELRFVGSCLEDLARKDYVSLREYELKSNDSSGYTTLMADSPGEELQNTLNIYVSLLHSTNTVCANSLFHILEGLQSRLQLTLSQGLSGDSKEVNDEKVAQDFLLLFTMAAHHPAFTFSQRIKLFDCLKIIKQLFCELGLIKHSHKERYSCTNSSVDNSTLPVAIATMRVSGNESQMSSMPERSVSFCRVHVTAMEPRRSSKNRSPEYRLETTWYDGEVTDTWRSFRDLKTFHEEVQKHLNKIVLTDESASYCPPLFPSGDKFPPNDRQMVDALNSYFRELFLLPASITQDDKFHRLFRELMKRPDTVPASASLSNSLSVALSVTKAEVCLSAPSSPHSVSPLSHLSKTNTKSSSDCFAKLAIAVTTSQLTTTSAQSSRSNHLLESTTGSVSSSQSHLTSSRSSPFLSSQGSRSRHNSSQGYNSIAAWLKDIRLHKYTDKLAKYTWEELFCLSEADLQKEGFTSGACKKFANEIHILRSKSGNNMEFLFESTNTSRPRNLSDAISPSYPAAPLAALIAKSVPGVSSPGSIDSSCSEYSTPPGSPEPRQSSSSKRGRAITGNQQQSQLSPAGSDSIQGVKEKEKIFVPSGVPSLATVVSSPLDVVSGGGVGGGASGTSDVPVIRSISLESSLAQKCSSESFGGHRLFSVSVETQNVIAEPDELLDVANVNDHFAYADVTALHESQASPPLTEPSQSAVEFSKLHISHGMTALTHCPVSPPQPWSPRAVPVRPFMAPPVGGTDVPLLGPRLHMEGTTISKKQSDVTVCDFFEEVTSGLNPRMPGPPSLDSSALGPTPLPIPSDAVLVRPRLPVGLAPVARIPAMASTMPPRLHDVAVVTSSFAPVGDTVNTTTSSPFVGNPASAPRVPLQPPPPIIYPPIVPVSPAAFPIPIIPTPNKANFLPPPPPQPSDVADIANPSAVAVLPQPPFSVDPAAPGDSRSLDSSSMPPGMATFMPGFFGLQSPLPAPPSNVPMMHAGLSYSVTVTSSGAIPVSLASNVTSFPADDSISDDIGSVCHQCGQWRPNAIIYPNMWPVEFPQPTCYSVGANNLVTPQHGSQPFRPLCGTQVPFRLPNGISPELHYQAACSYSITGTRLMHAAVRPVRAGPVPHYLIRCRTTAPVPPLTCSNCGASGHSHLECKEQTVESVLGSGQFHLGLIPKTETG